MSATCQGCGVPIPPSRGGPPRKWCSRRCRRQTLYGGACIDCGAPTTGDRKGNSSKRCPTCRAVADAALFHEASVAFRRLVEEMWAEGMTAREIGAALGWTTKYPNVRISMLRAEGCNLPHRRSAEARAKMRLPDETARERMAHARAARRVAA